MRLHPFALLCVLLGLAPVAAAQDRYDVEVIVFEHADAGDAADEHWRAAIMAPQFERAGSLEQPGAGGGLPEAFEPLRTGEGQLAGALRKLEESQRHRVLRHLRWRQPALAPGESVPVRVRAGAAVPITTPVGILQRPVPSRGNRRATKESAEGEGESGDGTGETESSAVDAPGEPDSVNGSRITGDADGIDGSQQRSEDYANLGRYGPRERTVAVHPLDGTIELVVSRYLHIHVDLYRTLPVAWQGTIAGASGAGAGHAADTGTAEADAPGPDPSDAGTTAAADADSRYARVARGPDGRSMLSFPFHQSRRMRSGKLHYIDHPRLGVLVLVTPHEPDEKAADEG